MTSTFRVALGVALCAASALGAPATANAQGRSAGGTIQHVVIVVQEARSFDDLFCGYHGANAAKCARPLQPIPLEANCTISDTFEDFVRDRQTGKFGGERADCPGYPHPQYGYVPHSETKPYFAIAQNYVLGDDMFSSTGNPTFEAHQYLIAAQAAEARDEPFGSAPNDGCVYRAKVRQFNEPSKPACFSYETLADELDAAQLSWAYYRAAPGPGVAPWDAYGWIDGSAGGGWYQTHSISPSTQFLTDVTSGKLASVTWVTPEFVNSDLSGSRSATGPSWVASVINAVGQSSFWNTTTIVVTWSGFGGWADHAPPPLVDFEGLGFRVPIAVVSPYAKRNYVAHVQYEDGSVLRYVEDTFGLQRLSASDSRANSLAPDCFDSRPRAFVPIPTR